MIWFFQNVEIGIAWMISLDISFISVFFNSDYGNIYIDAARLVILFELIFFLLVTGITWKFFQNFQMTKIYDLKVPYLKHEYVWMIHVPFIILIKLLKNWWKVFGYTLLWTS